MKMSHQVTLESNSDSISTKHTDNTNSCYYDEQSCIDKVEENKKEIHGNEWEELGESKTYSLIQSMLMTESPSWLAESTLFRKPVLQNSDILHHYLTGENEYNLSNKQFTDQPLIETTLEDKTRSYVNLAGLGSINSDNKISLSNQLVEEKPLSAFRGFFDKCLGKIFGKGNIKANKSQQTFDVSNRVEESEASDISDNPIFSLDLDSNTYTNFSNLSLSSRVDVPNDFESFVSDDQWLFNVVSAQKFKYLCTNCSKHCWEESGKVPNLL